MRKIIINLGLCFALLASSPPFLINEGRIELKGFIAFPVDFDVSEKGEIYVLDLRNPSINVFDEKGNFLYRLGRKGAGPGEFLKPTQISVLKNKICILDTGTFRYLLLEKKGKELVQVGGFTHLTVGAPEFNIELLDNLILSGDGYIKGNHYWTGILFSLKGKKLALLNRSPFTRQDPKNMMTYSLVDMDPDGRIYLVLIKDLKIYQFNRRGEPLRIFYQYPRGVRLPSGFAELVEKLKTASPSSSMELLSAWRKRFAWVVGLTATRKGVFLIAQEFSKREGGWKLWYQFFSHDGENLVEKKYLQGWRPGDDVLIRVKRGKNYSKIYILRFAQDERIFVEKYKIAQ